MKLQKWTLVVCAVVLVACLTAAVGGQELRKTVNLDGQWEIAQGAMDRQPEQFEHRVVVPGLVDMARPAFAEVGVKSKLREAFWYRRVFEVKDAVPAVARLKVHKAAYGSKVWVNGKEVGEHLGSFTPAYYDVKGVLKQGQNEVVIRVGAFRDAVPPTVPAGWDYEKTKYIPGIFDSVELILSGTPHIVNVQTVPDVEKSSVGVVAVVRNDGAKAAGKLRLVVREAKSEQMVGEAAAEIGAGQEAKVQVQIPIRNCRLWSPENPFLYVVEVRSEGDSYSTRFGMRTFKLDPATGRAVLNGKPYFMRGTNVTLYRFFEDTNRGDKPWDVEWVKKLHRTFQTMHWNSVRYCIGFPPELWYRIADEEGILVQDEFPIWNMEQKTATYSKEELIKEYTEWMQERWNHPSVVIWDAQNESKAEQIGPSIQAVRGLDLSGRPFDNGWSAAQDPGDVFESHPYLFSNANFKLSGLAKVSGVPGSAIPNTGKNAIIINEYCWLWLNRDGTVTTLTKDLYKNLLGADSTMEQRRTLRARYVAALTEFWRAHRACAGVLHFCGLGYSRPDGQTSDDFLDIEKLNFEPEFKKYVGDAFSPVGLMIDEWAEELPAGKERQVPVVVINDLYEGWAGQVRLRVLREGTVVVEKSQGCEIPPLGEKKLSFACAIPAEAGKYQLEAALVKEGAEPVRSLRDFEVLTAEQKAQRAGLAVGRPVKASSELTKDGQSYPAAYAADGDPGTRWSSEFSDPQWLMVDLGTVQVVTQVELAWEAAYGKAYRIEVSVDEQTWREVYKTQNGKGGAEVIRFAPIGARWVRLTGTKRATEFGYSLWEMKVFP